MKGIVKAISTRTANTRHGPKPVYGVNIDEQWYNAGFKDPEVSKGDSVTFEYTESKYGYDLKSINKESGSSSGAAWPIPKDSARDRCIMRQNAVTNALKMLEIKYTSYDETLESLDSATVISVARDFEAYYSGELDKALADKYFEGEE